MRQQTRSDKDVNAAMSILDRNISVTMSRQRLAGTPEFSMPAGYAIREYFPGDEHVWDNGLHSRIGKGMGQLSTYFAPFNYSRRITK